MNDMILDEDVKVFQNDVCNFYQNNMTRMAEVWAREWGLRNVRCFLAIQKMTSEKEYVLIENNEVVYATKQYEALGAHIDIMALERGLSRK